MKRTAAANSPDGGQADRWKTKNKVPGMKKRFMAESIAMLMLAGCTREDCARIALESQGFKNVKIVGYRFFVCDNGDGFADGFVAESQDGKVVRGVVCGGHLKGRIIRFDSGEDHEEAEQARTPSA